MRSRIYDLTSTLLLFYAPLLPARDANKISSLKGLNVVLIFTISIGYMCAECEVGRINFLLLFAYLLKVERSTIVTKKNQVLKI